MKKLFITTLAFLMLSSTLAFADSTNSQQSPYSAHKTALRDSQGRYQGYTIKQGDRVKIYDSMNRPIGYAKQDSSGRIIMYDNMNRKIN